MLLRVNTIILMLIQQQSYFACILVEDTTGSSQHSRKSTMMLGVSEIQCGAVLVPTRKAILRKLHARERNWTY
jgi:hypothetical protein